MILFKSCDINKLIMKKTYLKVKLFFYTLEAFFSCFFDPINFKKIKGI